VACLGAGLTLPGQASDSAGTASLFTMCADRFVPDVEHQTLIASHSIVPGRFNSFSFVNGGGLALQWFRDEIADGALGPGDAYEQLERMARGVEPGADGLLWLPDFQGRVLPPDPNQRGGWLGVTAGHSRAHLYRSILEGIALRYAAWARLAPELCGEGLTEVRAFGGGSRSGLWNAIKADVLGVPWRPMPRAQCALLGNALIAATATGHVQDMTAAIDAWHSPGEPVRPDPGRHDVYARLRVVHEELASAMDPVFARMRGLDDEDRRSGAGRDGRAVATPDAQETTEGETR
jgi:xylulokinase